jgi:hypothetical protein
MALLKAGAENAPVKKGSNKKAKIKSDKLPELKEYPDSKLLQGEDVTTRKSKAEDGKSGKLKKTADERTVISVGEDMPDSLPEVVAASKVEPAKTEGKNQETAVAEGGGMMLPDLPAMDTLTEEDVEMPKEDIDLMSVFDGEDEEDSATSDLAANLFDVDVSNIEKLGSEVSQFLNGIR